MFQRSLVFLIPRINIRTSGEVLFDSFDVTSSSACPGSIVN